MGDRAVSEVVGFVLVFSLVLATISVVYVSGFSGLQDTRDAERNANAERAFDVLANNIQEIARGQAPNRATEIKLSEARLALGTERGAWVNVSGADDYRVDSRSIRFEAGDSSTHFAYEHGAVIRADADGSVMVREPDFMFDDDRSVIRYITISGQRHSKRGDTTALVRGEQSSTAGPVTYEAPSPANVSVETHRDRAAAWERYLEREVGNCDVSYNGEAATVTCSYDPETLHVSEVRISTEIT